MSLEKPNLERLVIHAKGFHWALREVFSTEVHGQICILDSIRRLECREREENRELGGCSRN